MELKIIGTEEWKQDECVLQVEDLSFGTIFKAIRGEADVTQDARNQAFQHLKRRAPLEKHGASRTVLTGSWPSNSREYWRTLHPIGHVAQCYLGSS